MIENFNRLKREGNCDIIEKNVRSGCRDIWNAFMVKGATFTSNDIPLCPTTATELPHAVITWEEAKSIYKKHRIKKDTDFKNNAYVCWYIDDYKFDGPRGIWHDYNFAIKVLCHFAGVITPDFSTYQDFPEPWKIFNTYRMRAYGFWLDKNNIAVINNVRWGTSESYKYCFDGIPKNSIVAIGTCGGSPRKHIDRKRFEEGLDILVNRLHPHTIIVYGSANYDCFEKLKEQGINIVAFSSETAKAFERRSTMSKADSGHFSGTNGANKTLVDELVSSGEKCTPEEIVGITKDSSGKIIWLETGTKKAGLNHIIEEHGSQFHGKGISNDEIPNYIMEAVHQGNIVGYQGKKNPRTIYEFVYEGKKQRVAITVGPNGFIVGANPKTIKE